MSPNSSARGIPGRPGARPELLPDVVVYLASKTKINGTRLQKLMYLVEAEFADKHGTRLMDYEFHYHQFGMNSKDLEDRVRILGEAGGPLTIRYYRTDKGVGFEAKVRPGVRIPELPADVKEACDFVLANYAGITDLNKLIAVAKNTLPFYGTERRDRVDWSVMEDRCPNPATTHKLSEKGRKALSEAMAE